MKPAAVRRSSSAELGILRVLDAPRGLAFRAFTDPNHLAAWWGPSGNMLRRDEIEFLAGPGNQGWLEALEKLDATMLHLQAATTDAEM